MAIAAILAATLELLINNMKLPQAVYHMVTISVMAC